MKNSTMFSLETLVPSSPCLRVAYVMLDTKQFAKRIHHAADALENGDSLTKDMVNLFNDLRRVSRANRNEQLIAPIRQYIKDNSVQHEMFSENDVYSSIRYDDNHCDILRQFNPDDDISPYTAIRAALYDLVAEGYLMRVADPLVTTKIKYVVI